MGGHIDGRPRGQAKGKRERGGRGARGGRKIEKGVLGREGGGGEKGRGSHVGGEEVSLRKALHKRRQECRMVSEIYLC